MIFQLSRVVQFLFSPILTLTFLCDLWAFLNKNLQYLREKVLIEKILLRKKVFKKVFTAF